MRRRIRRGASFPGRLTSCSGRPTSCSGRPTSGALLPPRPRRAGQRWSALVSAPTSRVAHAMLRALGEAHWAAFVAHATAHYKPAFLAVFQRRVLRCVGRYGRPCPRGFAVELASPVAADALPLLHLDHEQDVQITCDMWRAALPPAPASWDDGIDGALLCHLLFGVVEDPVHGRAMLRFRCGPAGLLAVMKTTVCARMPIADATTPASDRLRLAPQVISSMCRTTRACAAWPRELRVTPHSYVMRFHARPDVCVCRGRRRGGIGLSLSCHSHGWLSAVRWRLRRATLDR